MLSVNTCLEALEVSVRDLSVSEDEQREYCRKVCLDTINALQTNNTLKRLELRVYTPRITSASSLFTQTDKDKMDSRVFLSQESIGYLGVSIN